MISASFCVQHHPKRSHLLADLRDRLGDFELVTDPTPAEGLPNPLRTYKECLRSTPESSTHRVVIQDDAWPCVDFQEKARTALADRPDCFVTFFVPGTNGGGQRRVLEAQRLGNEWADISGAMWVPTVALAWPVEFIDPFLEYAEGRKWAKQRGDDAIVHRFARLNKLRVVATVPSLVEHPDREPSLIGRRHGAGRYRNRVAALFDEGL